MEEGDTLVVETTNFSPKNDFRGAGAGLRLVESFTRVDADTIDHQVTILGSDDVHAGVDGGDPPATD